MIQAADNPEEFIGMVSDRRLLAWFDSYARETASFKNYLSNPVHSLSLPSLNLNVAVVSAAASASILDAMKLMSDEGVSSIAVVEEHSATLLSAVSVTDIGKVCYLGIDTLSLIVSFRLWFHHRAIRSWQLHFITSSLKSRSYIQILQ